MAALPSAGVVSGGDESWPGAPVPRSSTDEPLSVSSLMEENARLKSSITSLEAELAVLSASPGPTEGVDPVLTPDAGRRRARRPTGFGAWQERLRDGTAFDGRAQAATSLFDAWGGQRHGWSLVARFRRVEARSLRQSRDNAGPGARKGVERWLRSLTMRRHSDPTAYVASPQLLDTGSTHGHGVGPPTSGRGEDPHAALGADGDNGAHLAGHRADEQDASLGLDVPARSLPTFESYNYQNVHSRVRQGVDRPRFAAGQQDLGCMQEAASSTLLPIVVGVGTGAAAFASNAAADWLIDLKWEWTFALLHGGLGWGFISFQVFITLCVGLAACAAMLSLAAPAACGSGIPVIKATLNGVRVPGALSLQTLLVKLVGITLVVSSGMPAGREGPMVQVGSCIAALVLRAYDEWMRTLCCPSSQSALNRLLDEVALAGPRPVSGARFTRLPCPLPSPRAPRARPAARMSASGTSCPWERPRAWPRPSTRPSAACSSLSRR